MKKVESSQNGTERTGMPNRSYSFNGHVYLDTLIPGYRNSLTKQPALKEIPDFIIREVYFMIGIGIQKNDLQEMYPFIKPNDLGTLLSQLITQGIASGMNSNTNVVKWRTVTTYQRENSYFRFAVFSGCLIPISFKESDKMFKDLTLKNMFTKAAAIAGVPEYSVDHLDEQVIDFRGLHSEAVKINKRLPEGIYKPIHFMSIELEATGDIDTEKYPDFETAEVIKHSLLINKNHDERYRKLALEYDELDLHLSQLKQYASVENEDTIRVSLTHSHKIRFVSLERISITMDAHKLLSIIANHLTVNHR
jgi:hypothetical protein